MIGTKWDSIRNNRLWFMIDTYIQHTFQVMGSNYNVTYFQCFSGKLQILKDKYKQQYALPTRVYLSSIDKQNNVIYLSSKTNHWNQPFCFVYHFPNTKIIILLHFPINFDKRKQKEKHFSLFNQTMEKMKKNLLKNIRNLHLIKNDLSFLCISFFH